MKDYVRKGAREFARFPFRFEFLMPWTIQPFHVILKGAMVLDPVAINVIRPRRRHYRNYNYLLADVILKRIRITPAASEPFSNPFSVDWTGVPEVIDDKTSIKFYGHSSETTSDQYASDLYRKPEKQTSMSSLPTKATKP